MYCDTQLWDCPFAIEILKLKQPKKILLLGSGITLAPNEWFSIKGLEIIRFNKRTLEDKYYSGLTTYAIVCWKKTLPECLDFANKEKNKPYTFVIDDIVSTSMDIENKLFVFNDGHRFDKNIIGKWFANVSSELSKMNKSFKIYTTGFYASIWLLGGSQDEIYIAGFDGYKQEDSIHHRESEEDIKKFNYKHHDYKTEWLYIEHAIELAKKRGIKVFLSKDE